VRDDLALGKQARPETKWNAASKIARGQLSRSCGPKAWGREGVHASSPVGLIFLGGTISAGWNKIAAANVQTSDKASSFPMLDVPGCLNSQRLPKAVAVVIALKKTERLGQNWFSYHLNPSLADGAVQFGQVPVPGLHGVALSVVKWSENARVSPAAGAGVGIAGRVPAANSVYSACKGRAGVAGGVTSYAWNITCSGPAACPHLDITRVYRLHGDWDIARGHRRTRIGDPDIDQRRACDLIRDHNVWRTRRDSGAKFPKIFHPRARSSIISICGITTARRTCFT
jgi:hypothetical protein